MAHKLAQLNQDTRPYLVRPAEPGFTQTEWEIIIWPGNFGKDHRDATVIERFENKKPAVERAEEMARNQARIGVIVMKNRQHRRARYQRFIPDEAFFDTATGEY